MTIVAELESLSSNDPDGSIWKGQHREIISGQTSGTSVVQLTVKQAGAIVLMDNAAGHVFKLPSPVAGMVFDFFITVTRTSNAHKVITKTITTDFMIGAIDQIIDTTAVNEGQFADGTASHVAISMNGTTTGGIVGTWLKFTAINTTQWAITGLVASSGTLATPFASS